jgi:glutathione S-transferase
VFDDGKTIYGSLAIGMHAARTSGVLLPPDEDMDTLMHWAGIIMTDLVPAFAGQFYLGTLAPEKFQWGLDHYAEIIGRFLRGIDDHLGTGDYFLRCGFTLADVLMYPTAATSVARMPGALESYRNIARWAERVGGRPAVLRGMEASA